MIPGSRQTPSGYRPDIDGLRAIAVLAVLIFHLNRSWLPGGFVGVDIFFTISGYLITRAICQDVAQGTFSLLEFYRRRVKRIAPAMLVVVSTTLVVTQALLLPQDAREVAKSAFWTLASAANIFFWREQDTGYFAADSEHFPLLHLWSLGVEEQFYFLWPIVLLLLYRPQRTAAFLWSMVVAAAVSFWAGDALFDMAPLFTYYMLPTRSGELLLGAIVAIGATSGLDSRVRHDVMPVLAVLGAFLIAASLATLSESSRFPGLAAIPPTLGTALLIATSLHQPTFMARELGRSLWVAIGKVSYSAYLWHWPILAIYRYGYGEVTTGVAAGIFATTMLLAWLTYRFVEEPLRHSPASAIRVIARLYVLPAGALAVVTAVLIYPGSFGVTLASSKYSNQLEVLKRETVPAFRSEQVCQSQRLQPADLVNPACVLGAQTGEQPDALLWGDSNASHYVGMLEVIAEASGFRFRNIAIGSCPPLTGDPSRFIEARRSADCSDALRRIAPFVESFDHLIISASWTAYQRRSEDFLDVLFATVTELAARPGRRILLVGKLPEVTGYDARCREKALAFPWLTCPATRVPPSKEVTDLNERIRVFANSLEAVDFFDPTPFACPDDRCSAYDQAGRARYFDQSHLTMQASRALGGVIVGRGSPPAQFASMARSGPLSGR